MSRQHIHLTENIIKTFGTDEATGQFIQVTDKRYSKSKDDLQGEGYVVDWDELFGFSINLINAPFVDLMSNARIIELCDSFAATLEDDEMPEFVPAKKQIGWLIDGKFVPMDTSEGDAMIQRSPALEKVINERMEHFTKHNKTIEDDFEHNDHGELIQGAMALLKPHIVRAPEKWDNQTCDHMLQKQYYDRLILAATLLIAEADRVEHRDKIIEQRRLQESNAISDITTKTGDSSAIV